MDTVRKNVEEHFLKLSGVNGPPPGRKSRFKAKGYAALLYPAGRPLQYFLAAAGGAEKSALSGALGLLASGGKLRSKKPGQMIL